MFRQWSKSFCVALIPNKTGTRPYFQQELAWQSLPFFSARTHRPTRRRDEGHWYDREKLLSTQIAMATCVRQRDFEPDTHHASLGIGTSTEPLERETFVAAAPAPSKTRVAIIDDCDSMVWYPVSCRRLYVVVQIELVSRKRASFSVDIKKKNNWMFRNQRFFNKYLLCPTVRIKIFLEITVHTKRSWTLSDAEKSTSINTTLV